MNLLARHQWVNTLMFVLIYFNGAPPNQNLHLRMYKKFWIILIFYHLIRTSNRKSQVSSNSNACLATLLALIAVSGYWEICYLNTKYTVKTDKSYIFTIDKLTKS